MDKTILIEGKILSLGGLKAIKTIKAFEPVAETLKIKDKKKAWDKIEKALGRKSKSNKRNTKE